MNPPIVPPPSRGPNGLVAGAVVLVVFCVLVSQAGSGLGILVLWLLAVIAMGAGVAAFPDRRPSWIGGFLLVLPGPYWLVLIFGVPG